MWHDCQWDNYQSNFNEVNVSNYMRTCIFIYLSLQKKTQSTDLSVLAVKAVVICWKGLTIHISKSLRQMKTYHSFDNFSEYNMFSVQPSCFVEEDKELWAVSVCSVVSHGYVSGGFVADIEVFINKCWSIDTFTW